MIEFDITNIDLFIPKLDFEVLGENVELSNWFNCILIKFTDADLSFKFEAIIEKQDLIFRWVIIKFINYNIISRTYDIADNIKSQTILNLQRCKYEKDNTLFERDSTGRNCYLIEFLEGQSIEILAKQVIIEFIVG